jgi:hypothetical protein
MSSKKWKQINIETVQGLKVSLFWDSAVTVYLPHTYGVDKAVLPPGVQFEGGSSLPKELKTLLEQLDSVGGKEEYDKAVAVLLAEMKANKLTVSLLDLDAWQAVRRGS